MHVLRDKALHCVLVRYPKRPRAVCPGPHFMSQTPTTTDSGDYSNHAGDGCPSVAALEYELAFLVRHLEAVRRKYDYGLERAHYLLLLLLAAQDGQPVGGLAEQINLDASTVTRQIAAMQSCGLVDKRPNPEDRRGGFVTITAQGRKALERTRQQRLRRVGKVFSDWADDDRIEFARLMARFNRELSRTLSGDE